ncbi:hypothetical protein AGR1B_Cc130173 [Agrobacterium fabacearum S56]|nr:hypothetical protein AGR1B_Cc10001 [Agrobacterium fabacearum S56]CUW92131.1 hypothetical protein AGR1B_Cc130173 [Agrobacterium fabacearum S56]
MSLTSYRAAPPRVTSVNPYGIYRDQRKSLWDLSRLHHRDAVMYSSGANCRRRFVSLKGRTLRLPYVFMLRNAKRPL